MTAWLLSTLAGLPAGAQSTTPARGNSPAGGRIVGRVLDAETGTGIAGVVLTVTGTRASALSDANGRFAIIGVPAGSCTLHAQRLGYGEKTVTGIDVSEGGVVEVEVWLEAQALELGPLEVSAGAERGTVHRALDRQRTSMAMLNAVTAEQISRSPDADAAAAVQRVSGVTVQDGRFVYVRGLGERYTTTSLNGARLPSPEPERKLVPLDLFPANLLQAITTAKTFTPDQPGDFSGAQVNIETREFPVARHTSWSLSVGYNDDATGRPLPFAPSAGADWLGFAGRERRLPASARAAGNFETPPTAEQINRILRDFRNVWSPVESNGDPAASAAFSMGGHDDVLGRRVGYLLSATWSRSAEVKQDEVRAQALAGPDGETFEMNRFDGTTGRMSVLWGGLMNLSTLLGTSTRLALNATYNRIADNEARSESGFSEEFNLPLQIQRLRFVERAVWSTQLKGDHELPNNHRADWSLSASGVQRNEPDRSEIVYAMQTDPVTGEPQPPAWFSGSPEGAVRTFGELDETALEASANYGIALGKLTHPHAIRFGVLARRIARTADARSFSITSFQLTQQQRQAPPEAIFDGRYAQDTASVLRLAPLSQGGAYRVRDHLVAGYGMLELDIGGRLGVMTGARIEHSAVSVRTQPTVGGPVTAAPVYTDILPALTLNLRLSDRHNLRFSWSRTVSRPEYRELAPVMYRDVLGGDNVIGNASLVRTRIRNIDARWEWYPRAGEVLSFSAFFKRFDQPIERVYLATSSTRVVKYVNADRADNYGIEVEVRKGLDTFVPVLAPFTIFSNVTLMRSRIETMSNEARRTLHRRAMVGQAPYVVNAGLTWSSPTAASSATVLYNVVGPRIVNASEAPLPEIREQARHGLDVSLRLGITGTLSLRFDARNLLDPRHRVMQGSVIRESWRAGRTFSLGLSWQR